MKFPTPPRFSPDPSAAAKQMQQWSQQVLIALQALDNRVKLYTVQITGGVFPVMLDVATNVPPAGAWTARVEQVLLPGLANSGDLVLDWDWHNSQVRIRNIDGLSSGVRYDVTVAVAWQE